MNQKLSLSGFVGGFAFFVSTAGEIVTEHTQWSDFFATPLGAVHLVILGGSFAVMICGALGIQIPRTDNPHGDRASDKAAPPDPPKE